MWSDAQKKNFAIFSDCASSLQSIKGLALILTQIWFKIFSRTTLWENIVLCWTPSHVGIPSNEKADAAAKSPLSLSVTPMKLRATDM